MTLIALTECCRLLGIDGKTLRRWLAQAQLPVEAHPSDARCKGLSGDHLLLLASAHHRRLAGLPQPWPLRRNDRRATIESGPLTPGPSPARGEGGPRLAGVGEGGRG